MKICYALAVRKIILLFVICTFVPIVAFSQGLDAIEIVEEYPVFDEDVAIGDIVTYDLTDAVYTLARDESDTHIIGVVVDQPLILFDTENDGVPVARRGHVRVNVTDINGAIGTRDPITSSAIVGKGQLAISAHTYILGYALEPFPPEPIEEALENEEGAVSETVTLTVDDKTMISGSIMVDLAIGIQGESETIPVSGTFEEKDRETRTAIQYLLAAVIAIGSIFFAFRNFGSTIQNAIISMGRNPKAKLSIQLSLVWHLVIIIFISVSGIFLSIVILRLQLF